MLRDTTTIFRRTAQSQQVKLSVHTRASIPRAFRGDPVRIKQVVSNLLSNALKFTSEHGTISIDASVISGATEPVTPVNAGEPSAE